jgi:hypothetical protein
MYVTCNLSWAIVGIVVACVTRNKLQMINAKCKICPNVLGVIKSFTKVIAYFITPTLTPTFIHLFISFSKHTIIHFVFLPNFERELNFLYKPHKFFKNPILKLPFLQVIVVMCQGLNHINIISKSVFEHLNDYICYTNKFKSLCSLNMYF